MVVHRLLINDPRRRVFSSNGSALRAGGEVRDSIGRIKSVKFLAAGAALSVQSSYRFPDPAVNCSVRGERTENGNAFVVFK